MTPGLVRSVDVVALHLRLREPFAVTSGARAGIHTILVRVTTEDGCIGWGEASPDEAVTAERPDVALDALRGPISEAVIGLDAEDPAAVSALLDVVAPSCPAARAAVDIAVHDIASRRAGVALWRYLRSRRAVGAGDEGGAGGSITAAPHLRVSRVVGMAEPDAMAVAARRHVESGFRTVKVKVGEQHHWERDVERVAAVRAAVGDRVGIKVDVNEGWRVVEVAVAALGRMRDSRPLYVEQPIDRRDVAGLAAIRRRVPDVAIMADESVVDADDVRLVASAGAADLVNLKLMRTGGLRQALLAAEVASTAGLGVQVGTMIESAVASAAGLHLAAALGGGTSVEMGGPLLLAEDVADVARWYHGDRVTLPDAPGLGISPRPPEEPAS